MATVTTPTPEQVFAWRMQAFMEMGFGAPTAEALATTDVDLHEAQRLHERGCPLRLIVRILG